jgi:hypothetical protein
MIGDKMVKYKMRYGTHNIYIWRDFPEQGITIKRVVARIEGWDKTAEYMKRDILREAQERGFVKKQVRHYKNKMGVK